MTALLSVINRIVDYAFRLMQSLPPFAVLAIFAILTAVFALMVVRWTSDQKAIRRLKDRMGAHVLEVRLFSDQPGVVLRAYTSLLVSIVLYMRYALRSLFVLTVPLLFLFTQLETYFARTPVDTGQDFLVYATFRNADALTGSALRLPQGLQMAAPPVHLLSECQVDWRIKALRPGVYHVGLIFGGSEISKVIVVGKGLMRVVAQRERGGLWKYILNPAEPPIPFASVVERINVHYPERAFRLGTWRIGWLIPYSFLTLVAALLLKKTLRTEI